MNQFFFDTPGPQDSAVLFVYKQLTDTASFSRIVINVFICKLKIISLNVEYTQFYQVNFYT